MDYECRGGRNQLLICVLLMLPHPLRANHSSVYFVVSSWLRLLEATGGPLWKEWRKRIKDGVEGM